MSRSGPSYSLVATAASCCFAGFTALYVYYYYSPGSSRPRLQAAAPPSATEVQNEERVERESEPVTRSADDTHDDKPKNTRAFKLKTFDPSSDTDGITFLSSISSSDTFDLTSNHSAKTCPSSSQQLVVVARRTERIPQRPNKTSRRNRPRGLPLLPHNTGTAGLPNAATTIVRFPSSKSELIIRHALDGASKCQYLGWHREQEHDYAGALSCYRSELTLHRYIHNLNYDSPQHQMDLAQAHKHTGRMLQMMQCYPRAAAHFQKALNHRRSVVLLGFCRQQDQQTKCEVHLARSHHELGVTWMEQGEYRAARRHHHMALQLRSNSLGPDHEETALSYRGLALVYQAMGNFSRALALHPKALDIREKTLGKLHKDTAQSHDDVGTVLAATGDLQTALDHHQQALDIRKISLGEKHADTAVSYHHSASVCQAMGDYDTALTHFRRALRIRKQVLGPDNVLTAESYGAMGLLLQQPGSQQDLAGALVKHQRALRIYQSQSNTNSSDLANTYDNMGLVLHTLGDYNGALQLHQKSLTAYEDALGHDSEEVAVALNHIGASYHALGDYDKALQFYQQALQVAEIVFGNNHADTAITYSNIGTVLRAQGNFAGALEQHRKALQIKERVLGTDHADTAISYGQIGTALKDQGQYQEALQYYQRALEIEEVTLGNELSTTAALAHHNLGADLAHLGDTRGAWKEYRKSLHILLVQLRERQQGSHAVGSPETKNTTQILSHVVNEMVDLANAAAGRPPKLDALSSDEESTASPSPKTVPVAEMAEFFCGLSY